MINTYQIRMEAIFDNYGSDGDLLRLKREVSKLDLDLLASIQRCESAGDDCKELILLLEHLNDRLDRSMLEVA